VTQTEDASLRTVLVAVAANLLIAVAKAVAVVLTGSAAMLAETTHSVADTLNEGVRDARCTRTLTGTRP
jgi:divalent metal cation (Fe/Co/Zn/Cd) transporter